MRDETHSTDWTRRLDRYVWILLVAWTIVIAASLIYDFTAHEAQAFESAALSHGLVWLIGIGVIAFSLSRFRQELRERATVETALRDSEAKYRILAEQSPVSIVITDLKGNIEYVNLKFTQVTGYTLEEALGNNPRILKSGETPSSEYRRLWDTVLSGGEWRGLFHNKRKNGELFWESATIAPITNAAGVITHLLAVKEDITDRKRAEDEVRSLAKFPAENPNPVLRLQQDGRVLYANDTGHLLLQAWGSRVGDYAPVFWRELAASAAATRSGKVIDIQEGDRFWSFFVAPIVGEGYVNLYGNDITERKHTEQVVREERMLAEALRDTVADLNSTLQFDEVLNRILVSVGHVVPHDEANIMLISGDTAYVCQSRGHAPNPMPLAHLSIAQTPHLRQMIDTGQPVIVADVAHHPDWIHHAESDWVRSYISAPIRVKGETVGFLNLDSAMPNFFTSDQAARLAIFANQAATAVENARLYQQAQTELAERRKVEAQLQQAKDAAEAANRAKSNFLANMSHELRTPLNAILGFAQMLSRATNLTVDQRDDLTTIVHSGQHLLSLINDVLDMSKIESGRMTLHVESFDLRHLLDELEEMFRLRAVEKKLTLTFEVDPDLPRYVRADAGKLRQVLTNLLSNAVKFTSTGGVSLYATALDNRLRIDVTDTGLGMTADELAVVFEPFVQTTSGQKSQEGTGLGLSISRQFVRMMGGDIVITSVPGRGSCFTLDLIIEPAEAAQAPDTHPARRIIGLAPNQPTYRLLVVDDRESSRKLLIKLLAPLGFDMYEASNGQEAIDLWEQWQPHLIWMDMRMPVMDGHEATQRIKATTRGHATVIVALTASAFQEERDVILSEGCDDFVRKPVREEEIFDRLAKHLGVQFVYADDQLPRQDQAEIKPPLIDQPRPVTALPIDWLTDLQQATIQADLDRMLALINQLREHDTALANQLADWAHKFNYTRILQFIEHTGEQSP